MNVPYWRDSGGGYRERCEDQRPHERNLLQDTGIRFRAKWGQLQTLQEPLPDCQGLDCFRSAMLDRQRSPGLGFGQKGAQLLYKSGFTGVWGVPRAL